ncbi:hypothetical protein [Polaribacter vadi]|uniref:hypothetical protein n=1 Tax=Polaribacter vadi TaxID=1774273 RepID=UPI000AD27051|nr:hypothetical protein [Polaribacter vadi]|tara:strand:- start:12526 stop:12699 length:174 start_codon:yes stop_codon:yes gene_type:complete
MKNLRKIIALFIFILVAGIFVTVMTINTSLNKTHVPNETVEIQKDTVSLLKAEKKRV